jgi:putative tricarboxylic transport membrane protein
MFSRTCAFVVMISAVSVCARGQDAMDRLTIVAPAAVGGGWDQTAHAMARVLEAANIVRHVDVVNRPGAGGAIGLAEFINGRRGDAQSVLIGGLVMIGAIRANDATVSLLDTTPLARLISETEVIAVRSDAPVKTLADLIGVMQSQPGALVWTGGAYGGTDHLLLRLLADAINVDTSTINYIPVAGGGEALHGLLSGQSTAGVGGYSEFVDGLRSGRLRAIAISSDTRLPGIPIPTLKELGVAVQMQNWRGVFAPPGVAAAERDRLAAALDRMVHHPLWKRAVAEHAWTDVYLPGEPYVQFVRTEHGRIDASFAQAVGREHHNPELIVGWSRRQTWIGVVALLAIMLTAGGFVLARSAGRHRELALTRQLDDARVAVASERDKSREILGGLGEEIEKQFEKWGLTAAEREVALLVLKGLRHKEIACARNTTERTVRQQALAVYRKAGLDGRTDLAAFFLEDFLPPRTTSEAPITAAS